MRVAMIVNPKSGRGESLANALELEERLIDRGHHLTTHKIGTTPDDSEIIEDIVGDADRVVVAGGDGTVHHLLPSLLQSQTPMYHLASGTANLISKEFGMTRCSSKVIDHLEQINEPVAVDVPTCNGVPFLIMISLGIDASVIHRFENTRKERGGYRAYIKPILAELIAPRPARFLIKTNTSPPYQIHGNLIVSNLRSYGGGLKPSPQANPHDGLLDTIALPCQSSFQAGLQSSLLKFGKALGNVHRGQASEIEIESLDECFAQVDGERPGCTMVMDQGVLRQGERLRVAMSETKINLVSPYIDGL